jgi:hypothetical protein
MIKPPSLRNIISGRALLSSISDVIGPEFSYQAFLTQQITEDSIFSSKQHHEISIIYVFLIFAFIILQKELTKSGYNRLQKNYDYKKIKNGAKYLFIMIATFFKSIDSVS